MMMSILFGVAVLVVFALVQRVKPGHSLFDRR